MDRAHSLIAFASRWHACTGDVPPPLVGASITFVEVPVPRSRHTRSGQQQQQPEHPSKSSSSGGSAAGASRSTSTGTSSSSAASCTLSPRLYIFGGRLVSTRRMVADIWYLDLHTLKWTRIAGQSSADSRQSQDSDPRAKHDDAISPDEKSPTRRAKTVPSPRYFHSADAWDNKLIIYGGMGYLPAGTARPNQLVADTSSAAEAGTGATSGRAPGQPDEELCVLDDLIAFDLIRNEWDINFGKPVAAAASSSSTPPTPSHTAFWPSARYAHLSSVSSEFLIVLGGQNATNGYIARIDVFHLPSRVWVGYQPFQKQCGGYRSLVAAPKLVVSHSTRAPILDVEHAHRLANTAAQAATGPSTFRPLRSQSNASEAWGGSVGTAVESAPYDSRDVDRHRSDSTASRPSVLSSVRGQGGSGRRSRCRPHLRIRARARSRTALRFARAQARVRVRARSSGRARTWPSQGSRAIRRTRPQPTCPSTPMRARLFWGNRRWAVKTEDRQRQPPYGQSMRRRWRTSFPSRPYLRMESPHHIQSCRRA